MKYFIVPCILSPFYVFLNEYVPLNGYQSSRTATLRTHRLSHLSNLRIVYVTGHSLGAALATLAGFYLSCDPEIPKPVSSISFASPRVGDASFLNVVQVR